MTTPPGDPRIARTRAAVLAATLELVASEGFAGLTIDLISKRCGVARTTIYRHWPSLGALVFDAVANDASEAPFEQTDDAWADVERAVHALAARLRGTEWGRILPALIDAASRDPEIRELQSQRSAERRGALADLIERAKREGTIAPGTDTPLLVELLTAPLFTRHCISHLPVDAEFADQVLAMARQVAAP